MAVKEITPEEILARVLHRDGLMLIVDKPAGLAVHRGPKGGASLEDYFDALRYGLPRPPSLAHRLDKDTSGCLVLGRHRKALAHLGLLFKHGKVAKTYWAVVAGGPDANEGTIDVPLGRLDATRGWWVKPDPKGLPSVTTWTVLGRSSRSPLAREGRAGWSGDETPPPINSTTPAPNRSPAEPRYTEGSVPKNSDPSRQRPTWIGRGGKNISAYAEVSDPPPAGVGDGLTWLALTPVTGRTHQLRVHCAAMGWPIVGDNIYGNAPRFGGPALQLHAREIAVPISKNKEPVRVTAPVPSHMRDWIAGCGWTGEA
jgi:tRNA pseudouridine32 synthase/23S rRNA pseudouridine746 synthase